MDASRLLSRLNSRLFNQDLPLLDLDHSDTVVYLRKGSLYDQCMGLGFRI